MYVVSVYAVINLNSEINPEVAFQPINAVSGD
jgi:hypothetical protein